MADDVLELADKLWRGEIDISQIHPVGRVHRRPGRDRRRASPSSPPSPTCPPSPPETAWSSSTPDRPSWPAPSTTRCGGGRPLRLDTAIYSHGHIDHVFGVAGLRGGGRRARAGPSRWSSPTRPCRPDSTATSSPPVTTRSSTSASSGSRACSWPTTYRYPDRTYADRLVARGRRVGLRAPPRPGRDRRPHLDLGRRTRRCCAAATSSSGPPPTPATPRRSSATPGSGPWPCGRWWRSSPRSCSRATASPSSAPTGSARP